MYHSLSIKQEEDFKTIQQLTFKTRNKQIKIKRKETHPIEPSQQAITTTMQKTLNKPDQHNNLTNREEAKVLKKVYL